MKAPERTPEAKAARFGEALTELEYRLGKTRNEIWRDCGYKSKTYINNLLKCRVEISHKTALTLQDRFGVSAFYIEYGQLPMFMDGTNPVSVKIEGDSATLTNNVIGGHHNTVAATETDVLKPLSDAIDEMSSNIDNMSSDIEEIKQTVKVYAEQNERMLNIIEQLTKK